MVDQSAVDKIQTSTQLLARLSIPQSVQDTGLRGDVSVQLIRDLILSLLGPGSDITVGGGSVSGEWVHIQTQTITTPQAFVDFTLPTGHTNFRTYLQHVAPVSDDVGLWARLSNDGGTSFIVGSAYRYAGNGLNSSGSVESQVGHNVGLWSLTEFGTASLGVGNAAGRTASGLVHLVNPRDSATRTRFHAQMQYTTPPDNGGEREWTWTTGGTHASTQTHDAIRFLFESGNISSGRFILHGLKT